jgi:hypothetical protein
MEINLWVLVDNSGRIYYSDDKKEHCELFKNKLNMDDLKVIQLKGVL